MLQLRECVVCEQKFGSNPNNARCPQMPTPLPHQAKWYWCRECKNPFDNLLEIEDIAESDGEVFSGFCLCKECK